MPGGPVAPPPCRRCGSTNDYYASGLCSRCHLAAPQRVDSCRDCHAWGAARTNKWLCRACIYWRAEYDVGVCQACGATVAISSVGRVCRLCRAQARLLRGPHQLLDFVNANRCGAQLFFADMHKMRTRGQRPTLPAAGWPLGRPVSHRQLVLFDMAHDLSRGRGVVPPPRDAVLAKALDALTLEHAARHSWHRTKTTKVRSGIRLLLGMQDTPGAAIRITETAVLPQLFITIRPVLEVLDQAGMLEDDRTPAIQRWFDRHIAGLPEPMTSELRTWFDVMLNGSTRAPRRRPRQPHTIKLYVGWLLPALQAWVDRGHDSLREISREDVLAVLPASGLPRSGCGRALRSLFRILKARKLVFVNPAAGIQTWSSDSNPPMPIELAPLRAALDSPNPARALLVALVAFHGLRPSELRNLQLSDLRDRHLHISGRVDRVIPLAEPVRERATAYLDHRTTRWPGSPNPHLFIHFRTAARTEPVGPRWVWLTLDMPGSVRAIRQDRILHEALATGGDTRRLCDLFGLSIQAASRYTDAIREPSLDPE